MKRIDKYIIAIASLLMFAGCNTDETPTKPDGMVQIDFCNSGTFGAPLSSLNGKSELTGDVPTDPDPDGSGLQPYQPMPIEDGTTLWVAVYKGTPETPENAELVTVKSYRVSGRSLIPCKVRPDGSPEEGYDTPLFLPQGTYFFRALGPACELTNGASGNQKLSLFVDNGEWVIANDLRYEETSGKRSSITLTEDKANHLVHLDPLINQTARLKFTLYSDPADHFVHSLEMQPIGIEVSGLQDHYNKASDTGSPWNWTLCSEADTLIAYPNNKNTLIYLKEPLLTKPDRFVIETNILPTDATATPLIILFNMKINGNPTQLKMMLNRKVFRAGYSYHYRGKVSIDNGVTVLDWESVSWNAEIPFFPQ